MSAGWAVAGGLFAAVDVCYLGSGGARAALVAASDPGFGDVAGSRTAMVAQVAGYRPGEFWLRELPPLRAVCRGVADLALIVVDGYVDLDPAGRPGLGARVHAEFGVPVVGVAKTLFRGAVHAAHVRRGRAARPLYVTAAGMSVADAARLVGQMAGNFRIPDALRLADRLARGLEQPLWPAMTPRAGAGADSALWFAGDAGVVVGAERVCERTILWPPGEHRDDPRLD
jgi:deoxyribonuclease V